MNEAAFLKRKVHVTCLLFPETVDGAKAVRDTWGGHCNELRLYREFYLLANLGWVDLDLESSPGWWAATVASYCPSRMVEHPKSKSTQPRFASR